MKRGSNKMTEEVVPKGLSSGTCGLSYTEEDDNSTMVNVQPRLGRSKIFAREELMYANSQPPPPQQQFRTNVNPAYRNPRQKYTEILGEVKSSMPERPENLQRRSRQSGARRVLGKDAVDIDDENPLQRYENALLRYRKPGHNVGIGGLRRDRREPQYFGNNGYSSSDDSEGPTPRYHKSKSTSSIDTQSVNNILDEFEDLDYGRSSDLSDSGSINVTNFEAVMDQRKRSQEQQQQQIQLERSKEVSVSDDTCKIPEGQQNHDQRARSTSERVETVFKVNQQTQVRQRSRERQSNPIPREVIDKSNPVIDDSTRSRQDGENRLENRTIVKQAPEALLRKGEVQKRVDEWLNQTQAQNFVATSGKRESVRPVALVRSSSSAESKNSRRSRNDARARSTDENSADRLNGTASCDDINRTDATRTERKLDRAKNVAVVGITRGTYKDYLAGRNRSRYPTDYGFAGQGRSADTVGSKIPQRGHVNSRRRELSKDRNVDLCATNSSEISTSASGTSLTNKNQERNSSRRLVAAEARNLSGGFVKTRSEQVTCNGAMTTTTTTTTTTGSLLANGRATSFKRARSHERNNPVAPGRSSGPALVKEEHSTSSRMKGVPQPQHHYNHLHHNFVSKGQLACTDQHKKQQSGLTSPNKVGESRRQLAASRESRAHENPIEAASRSPNESIKQQQQKQVSQFSESKDVRSQTEESNFEKYSCSAVNQVERANFLEDPDPEVVEKSTDIVGITVHRSLDDTTPRSRLLREIPNGAEPRRPPAPPRRDQSRRDKSESLLINERPTIGQPCSSFRPNKRIFSAMRALNEQTPLAVIDDEARGPTCELSPVKSHYATPKPPQRMLPEKSLESEVIHANDLESILQPVIRASAYGEDPESQIKGFEDFSLRLSDNTTITLNETVFSDKIEDDNRASESSRISRYPEIGLDQCLKVQRRHPLVRNTSKELSPSERMELPTIHAKCWDQEIINEPAKTFGTFQFANNSQSSDNSNERTEKIDSFRINENIDEILIADSSEEPTYHEPDLIPKLKVSIADSYEARSTLRLDRNFNGGSSKDSAPQSASQEGSRLDDLGPNSSTIIAERKISDVEEKRPFVQDTRVGGAVVNEVLVKNLRFQHDLPKSDLPMRLGGPIVPPKPFNFNSVLSDDYEKIQADDCAAKRDKESKIYVTKEEMERQRLIDLLKRRDWEAVKLVSTIFC